jgi:hypothetical protein
MIVMTDTQAIAGQVGTLLYKLEMLIDEAVSCGAELTAALPRARVEAKLPALVGQHSLDTLTEAVQSLVAARRQTIATHKHLDKVRELMGLPVISFGEEGPKPQPKILTGAARPDHLRVIAA